MGNYFTPWRRKAGVMSLVVACVFMGGWVRSMFRADCIGIRPYQSVVCSVGSYSGLLSFDISPLMEDPPLLTCGSITLSTFRRMKSHQNGSIDDDIWFVPAQQRANWIGEVFFRSKPISNTVRRQIPYWAVVIPLTLLSTYLLASNTRPTKSLPSELVGSHK